MGQVRANLAVAVYLENHPNASVLELFKALEPVTPYTRDELSRAVITAAIERGLDLRGTDDLYS